MRRRPLWLPMLGALDCLRHPFEVARLVRLYCAGRDARDHDHERLVAAMQKELDEVRAENMQLRAERGVSGFYVRGRFAGWS
jgi:hypothetical protein